MSLIDRFRTFLSPAPRGTVEVIPTSEGVSVRIDRGRTVEDLALLGKNQVHAVIHRRDGAIEDLGVATNLRTDAGDDWQSHSMGGRPGDTGTATSTTATSLTDTGKAWTTNAWTGHIVVAGGSIGSIVSNTATVLTIGNWLNGDYTAGSTPGGTSAYDILPTTFPAVYIGLTANNTAPAVTDTALTGEHTTGGLARARATYAHTVGTNTYTLTVTFNATATLTAEKAGLFTGPSTTASGMMAFSTLLNAPANLVAGDAITITWTVTI